MKSEVNDAGSGFEEIEHTADWALRIRGRDLRELLVNAAFGMSRLLVPNLDALARDVKMRLALDADDAEGLLVNWLGALIYRVEVESPTYRFYMVNEHEPI